MVDLAAAGEDFLLLLRDDASPVYEILVQGVLLLLYHVLLELLLELQRAGAGKLQEAHASELDSGNSISVTYGITK